MSAGLAERLFQQAPERGPVTITDCAGKPRWQPIWEQNPAIGVTQAGPRIASGGGCLPYLVYPRLPDRLTFNPSYRVADARGHFYPTPAERETAQRVREQYGPFVLLEASPADRKNQNRVWPMRQWAALVKDLQRTLPLPILHFDHPTAVFLPGVPKIPTPDFRMACALMSVASLVVCLEGGTAFGAAAVHAPAVVLWGGCVSSEVLSLPDHVNLSDQSADNPACGMLVPCDHCTQAWAAWTPDRVGDAVRSALTTPLARVQ